MAANPQLREELAACLEMAIPHSRFLGGDGVWTDLDRAKALGYKRYLATLCPHCRTTERDWREDPDAFTWQIVHCEGCKRLADGQEDIEEGQKGKFVSLVPPRFARADE